MPTPLVDEFRVTLGGTEYRFRWAFRDLMAMQEALADPVTGRAPTLQQMDDGVTAGRLRYLRTMVWAGLQAFHPELSEERVTDLVAGASAAEMKAVLRGFGYSVRPDPKDAEALGLDGHANPPTAQTSMTGADSTSSLARPV